MREAAKDEGLEGLTGLTKGLELVKGLVKELEGAPALGWGGRWGVTLAAELGTALELGLGLWSAEAKEMQKGLGLGVGLVTVWG